MATLKRVLKSTRPHMILGSLLCTHGPLPGRKISLPPTQASSSPRDATGEEHLYAQKPVLTVGQLPKWTGEAWDLLATFESWGLPWLLLGRVFLSASREPLKGLC